MQRTILLLLCLVGTIFVSTPVAHAQSDDRLTSPVDLLINLDLTDAYFGTGRPESVALLGTRGGLKRTTDEPLLMEDPDRDYTWNTAIEIDAGEYADMLIQFAYLIDGHWVKETSGPHSLIIPIDKSSSSITMIYTRGTGISAAPGEEENIDDFDAIRNKSGSRGDREEGYAYYSALHKLESGRFAEALSDYAIFLQDKAAVVERDDFPIRYARARARTGDTSEAIAYLNTQLDSEPASNRKALFLSEIGLLHQRVDRVEEARKIYQSVLTQYPGQAEASNRSRLALANSYLIPGDSLSLITSRDLLIHSIEGPAPRGERPPDPREDPGLIITDSSEYRVPYQLLAQVYYTQGDLNAAYGAYFKSWTLGNPYEQLRSRIQAWKIDLERDRPRPVISAITSLLNDEEDEAIGVPSGSISNESGRDRTQTTQNRNDVLRSIALKPALHAPLLHLLGRAYRQAGQEELAKEVFQELSSLYPDSPYAALNLAISTR